MNESTNYFQQRHAALEQFLDRIAADYGVTLHATCSACPVEIEGEIDGWVLYFYARWGAWNLSIAADLDHAVRAHRQSDARFYHKSSAGLREFEASWLTPAQVDQVLRACLAAFRAGKTNAGYVEL